VAGAGDRVALAQLEVVEPGLERLGVRVVADEDRGRTDPAVDDALLVAMVERAADLVDEGDALRERQRRVLAQERIERHAVVEGLEQHGRAERRVGDVLGVGQDVGVAADLVQELGLAIGGAPELLASLDAGLFGHQVGPGAPGHTLEVAVRGHAILVGVGLGQQFTELVWADQELALARAHADLAERGDHRALGRRVDALARTARAGAWEGVVGDRRLKVVATDDAGESVGRERQRDVLVAEEHQRLDPRRADAARQRALEARLQDLGLAPGQPKRVFAPDAPALGRHPGPIHGVTLHAASERLELDQVQARVAQHEQVDLVEPPGRRVEEVHQRPEVVRIGVGQRRDRERDPLLLVGV
jgi:hypothetical protein